MYKDKLAFQIVPSEISSEILGPPLQLIPKTDLDCMGKIYDILSKIKLPVISNSDESKNRVNKICIGFGTNKNMMAMEQPMQF